MRKRLILISLGAAGLVAVSTLPAAAQLDDFLCSTFSYKCAPPPPPPPPQLAPEAAPVAPPPKHVHKAHKRKVKTAKAKADSDAAPAAPAPDAAPK